MQKKKQKLINLMKSLEMSTCQQIQALQNTMVKRFESIEERIRTEKQGEQVQAKDLVLPVSLRVRGELLIALATYSLPPLKCQQMLNNQMDTKNVNRNQQG